MKETMRIAVAHALVGVLVFIAALVFFNYRISAEKGNPVTELQNSTYPVMEIGNSVSDYNVMSAYRGDIDLSLVRDQITVVDHSKTLELKLHNYDYEITAIQYVLFENNPYVCAFKLEKDYDSANHFSIVCQAAGISPGDT